MLIVKKVKRIKSNIYTNTYHLEADNIRIKSSK